MEEELIECTVLHEETVKKVKQKMPEDDFIYDDFTFEVLGAKRGLKGYEILETDNGIDVILHYDKYEEEQK